MDSTQKSAHPSSVSDNTADCEDTLKHEKDGFLHPPASSDQHMEPENQENQPSLPKWDAHPSSVSDNTADCEDTLKHEKDGFLHPPASSDQHMEPENQENQPSLPKWEKPSLSKHDAQQAFIKYATDKCCWSTKPAEEGQITNMEAFDTYRYCLETFTESRSAEWTLRPYYGETIDSSGINPPGLWDIPVTIPPFFEDGEEITDVPHMASVKDCSRCDVNGRISCILCSGTGQAQCMGCGGIGYFGVGQNRTVCFVCGGLQKTTCWQCFGLGWLTCHVCLGQRKVITSINLTVKWTNNKDEHTVEHSSGLKMDKLDKVPGKELFTDSQKMVDPVTTFPDDAVVQISESLVRDHKDKYLQQSHILQQRHTIELLPVTKVTYEWKGKPHVFFVYGTDLKVNTVDYPAACCGCCSLM